MSWPPININIEAAVASQGTTLSAAVLAICQELSQALTALLQQDQTYSIDIRSIPLTPFDQQCLRSILGEGEVHATVSALGPTQIEETAVPGIWWVRLKNESDELLTEIIEVCRVPGILAVMDDDLDESCALLQSRIDAMGSTRV